MPETTAHAPRFFKEFLRAFLGAFYGGLSFLGAGRVDWERGWVYFAFFLVTSLIGSVAVHIASPGLIAARVRGIRKDTKPFDKLFFALFGPLIIFYPILAGLDAARFAWAPLPYWTVYFGALLFGFGSIVSTWTMVVNRNAELTVRIQKDRGHAVITHGPYRIVRHPMYASVIVGMPATALILGSAWSFIPMALIMALFVWRTAQEDRVLHAELEGYADYAKTVRFKLLPGVW